MRIKEEYSSGLRDSSDSHWLGRIQSYRQHRLRRVLEQNERWVKEAQDAPPMSELLARISA